MLIKAMICVGVLHGCSGQRVIEKPIVVTVSGPVKHIEVPAELLVQHNKTTIPESLTYGEAMQLWGADRATIDTQNGQTQGIAILNLEDSISE